MSSILYALQDRARETSSSSLSPKPMIMGAAEGPLKTFKVTLDQLAENLEPTAGRRKLLTAITWPYKEAEINKILKSIEQQKTSITLALELDHSRLSEAIRKEVALLSNQVRGVDEKIYNLCNTEDSMNIQHWLDAPDPHLEYSTALRQRCPATGSWFLKENVYEQWLVDTNLSIWLHGNPGCGKTFLCATVLEHILALPASGVVSMPPTEPSYHELYFFFDGKDDAKQRLRNMIRSLVQQMCTQLGGSANEVRALFSACGGGKRQPECEQLLTVLHQLLSRSEGAYLVIDALDECHERHGLLTAIQEIANWEDVRVHLFFTSRREAEIEDSMAFLRKEVYKVRIDSDTIDPDIRRYVRHRLQKDPALKRWHKDQETQYEIEAALTTKANGMFKWVACQLDQLSSALSIFEVRKLLKELPKDLDGTYTRVLNSIAENRTHYVFKVLKWLACSKMPVTLWRIAEIITIDVDEDPRVNFEKRFRDPKDVLTICPSLIVFKGENLESTSVLELAHSSVREYLVHEPTQTGERRPYSFREPEAHAVIARDCIAYLLDAGGWASLLGARNHDYPLLHYAIWQWIGHAEEAIKDKDVDVSLLVDEFLASGNDILRSWIHLHCSSGFKDTSIINLSMRMLFAELGGLSRSVKSLLDPENGHEALHSSKLTRQGTIPAGRAYTGFGLYSVGEDVEEESSLH
ncbi:MAG: hypothetical protein Q9183_002589 [Haloplaca sp. 2 TL-2023]